jgi:hypothetical protein
MAKKTDDDVWKGLIGKQCPEVEVWFTNSDGYRKRRVFTDARKAKLFYCLMDKRGNKPSVLKRRLP